MNTLRQTSASILQYHDLDLKDVWKTVKPSNFRQGYTVRSSDGYRYTEYVDYDPVQFQGHWTDTPIDAELYDLNADQWETTNAAAEPGLAGKVRELMAALRAQYSPVGGSN